MNLLNDQSKFCKTIKTTKPHKEPGRLNWSDKESSIVKKGNPLIFDLLPFVTYVHLIFTCVPMLSNLHEKQNFKNANLSAYAGFFRNETRQIINQKPSSAIFAYNRISFDGNDGGGDGGDGVFFCAGRKHVNDDVATSCGQRQNEYRNTYLTTRDFLYYFLVCVASSHHQQRVVSLFVEQNVKFNRTWWTREMKQSKHLQIYKR